MKGKVRTVAGDVDAAALGVTYAHEHLIARPPEVLLERFGSGDDLTLDDEDRSAAEMELFAQAGGQAIVECSDRAYGRDPGGLARLSERTGVKVVAATGHIQEGYWRGIEDHSGSSVDELTAEMVNDLTEGFPDAPEIRAGVIKVGTSKDEVHPDEEKMLTAAAHAQRETGAPITTHTTAGTIPLEQVRIFQEAGADLSHVVIGHQDRRLVWEDHLAVVEAGANLGYDCISKEQYEPDSLRIEFIAKLIEAGYGDRIVLGGDIARRSYFTSWGGGPGFTYILWRFVPWMWKTGIGRESTDAMLKDNPARIFAWTA
jgi:predicted metal-dependent phosphotriesterase family hydrolase